MSRKKIELLLKAAKVLINRAYAPYSGFRVGAAVLSSRGKVYAGANVENASLGLTVCAERAAIFQAVNAGEQKITALLVYTPTKEFTPPCGACLQVLSEFGDDPEVILANESGIKKFKLRELLPCRFRRG